MGIDYREIEKAGGIGKPEPRARVRGRADREEARIIRVVRKACEDRDGYCLVQRLGLPGCKGPSEWAHLAGHRRSQTMGMHPTRRHDTRFTAQLCKKHHNQEEDDKFHVIYLSDKYADGPVRWEAVSQKGAS